MTGKEPDTLEASLLENQASQTILDLKYSDLLGFLQLYQACCPNLQMICSWVGVPAPYIDITLDSSLGLSAKIELSLRLSEALVKYMLASKISATKVAN